MTCFPLDNTSYTAEALGAWFGVRTRGVLSGDGQYSVAANGDMSVTASPGVAWLKRDDYWGAVVFDRNNTAFTIALPDPALDRIDAVCIRLDKNNNTAAMLIKQGEYDVAPVIPAITRDINVDEIYIASIYVRAGATTITAADITDQRTNEAYCGVVRDGITGIPTDVLQAQAEELIDRLQKLIDGVVDGSQYMLAAGYNPAGTPARQIQFETDDRLETEDKTVAGAVNELKANKANSLRLDKEGFTGDYHPVGTDGSGKTLYKPVYQNRHIVAALYDGASNPNAQQVYTLNFANVETIWLDNAYSINANGTIPIPGRWRPDVPHETGVLYVQPTQFFFWTNANLTTSQGVFYFRYTKTTDAARVLD